jgi:hypothetical protein
MEHDKRDDMVPLPVLIGLAIVTAPIWLPLAVSAYYFFRRSERSKYQLETFRNSLER